MARIRQLGLVKSDGLFSCLHRYGRAFFARRVAEVEGEAVDDWVKTEDGYYLPIRGPDGQ